jgi:hypothetical protein
MGLTKAGITIGVGSVILTTSHQNIGFSGLRAVASREIVVHGRADRMAKPGRFYLEPGANRRDVEAKPDIMRYHQVDPTRKRTLAGIMPNLELLKSAGNPYPTGPSDPLIQGKMTWAPYIEVSHAF